jgi:hypothetical protein
MPYLSPRPLADPPTDSYRLARAFLVLLSIMVIDVFNILDRGFVAFRPNAEPGGPVRYLVLLVPLVAVVAIRMRRPSFLVRLPTASEGVLMALFALGLTGSLVGSVLLGAQQTARPTFLPMFLGLLALLVVQPPTDHEIGKMLRWLSNLGFVYIIMNALVNVGILPFSQYQQYRNASVAFLVIGLGAAAAAGQRRRLAVESVLAAVVFITYPSATMVLALLVLGFTLYLTAERASTLRSVIFGGLAIVVAFVAITNLQAGIDLSDRYFELVNKANANSSRIDLWSAGIDTFERSPLVGSVFSGEAVAERSRDGKALPYHNDFILFLALGGLLGIGLLLAFIIVTEVTMIRWIHRFRRAGQNDRANLLRAILVGLNAFFVAMGFNPVLSGASRSAAVFGLYAIAMSVGASLAGADDPFHTGDLARTGDLSAPVVPSA